MKNFSPILICILICLAPTYMAGQALQVQNNLLPVPGVSQAPSASMMQFSTDSSLLRISALGPLHNEGIQIELNALDLSSPGPTIFLDCPDPLDLPLGAIRLRPSQTGSHLTVSNIGSSGQDGVSIELEELDPVFRPSMRLVKPTIQGPQSAIILSPSQERSTMVLYNHPDDGNGGLSILVPPPSATYPAFLTRYDYPTLSQSISISDSNWLFGLSHTFDTLVPSLRTRISHSDASFADSFFDITYDLLQHHRREAFHHLHRTRLFQPSLLRIRDRVATDSAGVDSFFDVFYDISNGEVGRSFGDPVSELLFTHEYEKSTPKLTEKISSTVPAFADSFFDIAYDLSLRSRREAFQDLHHTRVFTPSLLTVHDRVATDVAGVDSFFDVFYDISASEVRHSFGDPVSELLFTHEYEKSTPKLSEKISSTDPLFVDSFFDIAYDLSLRSRREAYQDLHHTRVFSPSLLTVHDRVATDAAGVDSFFDVFYDISTGEVRRSFGDPTSELLLTYEYEKATPKLLQRVHSTDPLFVDSFFDIAYDLSLRSRREAYQDLHHTRVFSPSLLTVHDRVATDAAGVDSFFDVFYDISTGEVRRSFGDPTSELLLTYEYEKATPKLLQRVHSTDPLFVDSFFDIAYDLSLRSRREAYQDLHHTRVFSPSLLTIHDRVATDVAGVDSFFDIFYNLSTGEVRRSFGDGTSELQMTLEYEKSTPKLSQRIQSTDPLYVDSFFDVVYNISQGHRRIVYQDLALIDEFQLDAPRVIRRFESDNPAFAGRFIEHHMDIQTELVALELTSAGFPGLGPLEVHIEYDGLSRVIREQSVDTDNGATLLLERQLSPTGSTLVVGGNLQLNGGSLSSTGPLDIIGPATVIGNLHVNGVLSADIKLFKIDHPLDPDNKYLVHSCVESPDMMNIYNGNVTTDEDGYAMVIMPDYFEALNTEFRYQLTCIGQFAQAIVSEKIIDNRFVIQTDKPGVEVSWQVTGVRHDPAAKQEKFMVEVEKSPEMKGTRLYR